jgi:hypothetical protein
MRALGCALLLGCVYDGEGEGFEEQNGSNVDDACPVWGSISPEGSTRSFVTTDEYVAQTGVSSAFVTEVLSITAGDGGLDVLLEVVGSSESDSWTLSTYETLSHYFCDVSGAWILSSETSGLTVVEDLTVETHTETVYTDSFIMPQIIELGDSWQSVFSGTTTDSTGTSTDHRVTIDSEVSATDTVTVEAGSFSALVISETFEDGSSSSYRVAEGPGFLLSEDFELVAYEEPEEP